MFLDGLDREVNKGHAESSCAQPQDITAREGEQQPLLAEELVPGVTLAAPRRSACTLEALCPGQSARCAELHLVGLCLLVTTETSLVHYTKKAPALVAGKAEPGLHQSTDRRIDDKYWKRRYNYFSRFDEGIRMDEAGWFEVTPESVARHIADRMPYNLVVDGSCGVGGNAIQFAMTSRRVIAVDIDAARVSDARHNAGIYGVQDRIDFVCDDFVHFVETYQGPAVDAVFLSPPWGGPAHLDAEYFSLRDVEVPDIIALFAAAARLSKRVVLYLPRHQDLHEIALLALAYGFPAVEVEKVFFQHPTPHLKLCMVYFGSDQTQLAALPLARRRRTIRQTQRAELSTTAAALLDPSPLAGPVMRAVYCRSHYLGRYIVGAALEHGRQRAAAQARAQSDRVAFRQRVVASVANALEVDRPTADSLDWLLDRVALPDVLRLVTALALERESVDAKPWLHSALQLLFGLVREEWPELHQELLAWRKGQLLQG